MNCSQRPVPGSLYHSRPSNTFSQLSIHPFYAKFSKYLGHNPRGCMLGQYRERHIYDHGPNAVFPSNCTTTQVQEKIYFCKASTPKSIPCRSWISHRFLGAHRLGARRPRGCHSSLGCPGLYRFPPVYSPHHRLCPHREGCTMVHCCCCC